MHLVCLLEEPSAKELLAVVLPKVVPDAVIRFIVFEGKSDLEKNIEFRLKHWQAPDTCFLVLRDKDSGDCKRIKQGLVQKVQNSGKQGCTCVRIACHELESFYLGDLKAVESGLSMKNLSNRQKSAKYRHPDNLANAAQELSKLTNRRYSKISGSRKIAPHMAVDGTNMSNSFNVLIEGVASLVAKSHT